jgi:hypothetical protein
MVAKDQFSCSVYLSLVFHKTTHEWLSPEAANGPCMHGYELKATSNEELADPTGIDLFFLFLLSLFFKK